MSEESVSNQPAVGPYEVFVAKDVPVAMRDGGTQRGLIGWVIYDVWRREPMDDPAMLSEAATFFARWRLLYS
ncbi:unnamed protein product [marine sediment metagenome]|uniref:Uncharacterized protein n=1 Tax=marine sediment metagenome TaxID=412755 RepID=X0S5H1_9ZZZZ